MHFLLSRGLKLDAPSYRRFLVEAGKALVQAAGTLERNAEGDYRPDPAAARFPVWEPSAGRAKATSRGTGETLQCLLAGWWSEAQATGRKPSTHESYKSAVEKLEAFLECSEAASVTKDDIIRFKAHRLASINPRTGKLVSPKTVKGSDLTGLKAVFGWAVDNGKLPANPAEEVSLKIGKKARTRDPGFSDEEACAVLSAAFHVERGGEGAKVFAAKRWVPWLLAYSGARLGEMAQLRKEDVRQEVAPAWSRQRSFGGSLRGPG